MNVLVLNSGSSSLKFQVIESKYEQILIKGVVEAIGLPNCAFKYEFQHNKKVIGSKMGNHEDAVKLVLNTVDALLDLETDKAIGHRVVHGGEYYKDPVIITGEVTRRIRELIALAPLHNPHNLAGILACKKLLPK